MVVRNRRKVAMLRALALQVAIVLALPAPTAEAAALFRSCAEAYARVRERLIPPPQPALAALEAHLFDRHADLGVRTHSMKKVKRRASVKIGYLERNQKKFMALLLKAVREGSVAEIDSGDVVGAKVLSMLDALSQAAALDTNIRLRIAGRINWKYIEDDSEPYVMGKWAEKEREAFRRAWRNLSFRDCKNKAEEYYCRFEFLVANGTTEIRYYPNR